MKEFLNKLKALLNHETIAHDTFTRIRWMVLGVFWVVCVMFTMFLFTNLAWEPWVKAVWILVALAWEGGVLIVVTLLKTAIVKRSGIILNDTLKIGLLTLAYLVFASVSFLGSIGYNIANSNHQASMIVKAAAANVDIKADEYKIEQLKKDNAQLDRQIESDQAAKEKLPADYVSSKKKVQDSIDSARDGKTTNQKEIDRLSKEIQSATVTDNGLDSLSIFSAIGTVFDSTNWDIKSGTFFRNLIFVIIGLVLLIVVALAAPTIDESAKLPELTQKIDHKELEAYLNALFDGVSKRLNNDKTISDATGIDVEQCLAYRKYLLTTTYKGVPMFTRDSGGTKANFPRDHIIKMALFYAKMGKIEESVLKA